MVISLISELEDQFQIEIDKCWEIIPENLNSVNAMENDNKNYRRVDSRPYSGYLLLFLLKGPSAYQLTPKKADGLCWQPHIPFSGYVVKTGALSVRNNLIFTHYIAAWISWIKTKCNDETAGM